MDGHSEDLPPRIILITSVSFPLNCNLTFDNIIIHLDTYKFNIDAIFKMGKPSKSKIEEILKKQAAEQATPLGGYVSGRTPEERMENELRRIAGTPPPSPNTDFSDIPTSWLKQELAFINRILAKLSYYSSDGSIRTMMSEFIEAILPSSGSIFVDDGLARISEVVKKFENFGLIHNLDYGEPEMQHTTIVFHVNADQMRLYKTSLIKEIQLREGEVESKSKDRLENGKLVYSIDNREVVYSDNKSVSLSPTSDYGRFLTLLMSNIDKRVSYAQICDAVGIDYKTEGVDPEKDAATKRQIQQIKKDLLKRLKTAGVPPQVLIELIVARDGYKMNKIE